MEIISFEVIYILRKKHGSENPPEKHDPKNINLELINEKLIDCPDILRKKIYIENQYEAFFIYLGGLTNQDLLQRDFITPVVTMNLEQLSDEISIHNLPCIEITLLKDSKSIVDHIMSGKSVLICDKLSFAISCLLTDIAKRDIDEPVTEKNVRGPHEGFIEPLQVNLSILRRKIKNDKLKFKTITLGVQTKQQVVVAYIEGIANMSIINSLFDKISDIKIDGLPAVGFIEQSIASHPHSLFPQFLSTERPDKAMAALLEGRAVVLQDGAPAALIAPVSFASFFQALDDYSNHWIAGSFMRFIRIFSALFIAVMLPALYIAITSFHYYAVPLSMLVPLAESRARVPFPPIIEVLILEFTVEMIREAAIRLPTYIGTAVSVVAGLIIGDAAVRAGLVSNLLIVIVAATAIASYLIPSSDMAMAIRILRFTFIICASVFGILGIVVSSALTAAHLLTLESLGQPYFQPFSPLNIQDLKDSLLRFPLRSLKTRPSITRTNNKTRSRNNERKK